MDRLLIGAAIVGVVVVIFVLLAVSWRRRTARQAASGALSVVEAAAGTAVLYLATTRVGRPLERISSNGLGFRSRGTVGVTPAGVVLALDGEPARLLPSADLLGAGHANWTIDRATGGDRLVALRWRLGDDEVESFLRAEDPDALLAALTPALPALTTPAPATESDDA